MHRRFPSLRRARTPDVDPLEQHRQLVNVDLYAEDALDDSSGKREGSLLEALMHDRESAARVHEQLDLRLSAIEEHEHVTGERVIPQHLADLVRQALE